MSDHKLSMYNGTWYNTLPVQNRGMWALWGNTELKQDLKLYIYLSMSKHSSESQRLPALVPYLIFSFPSRHPTTLASLISWGFYGNLDFIFTASHNDFSGPQFRNTLTQFWHMQLILTEEYSTTPFSCLLSQNHMLNAAKFCCLLELELNHSFTFSPAFWFWWFSLLLNWKLCWVWSNLW